MVNDGISEEDETRVQISLYVEKSTLDFIDRSAKEHKMSRNGFMVYSALKYAKELINKETDEVLNRERFINS
jgi:uncharacterized protein (DUF1778 family)